VIDIIRTIAIPHSLAPRHVLIPNIAPPVPLLRIKEHPVYAIPTPDH
jgi:hypothetical protein